MALDPIVCRIPHHLKQRQGHRRRCVQVSRGHKSSPCGRETQIAGQKSPNLNESQGHLRGISLQHGGRTLKHTRPIFPPDCQMSPLFLKRTVSSKRIVPSNLAKMKWKPVSRGNGPTRVLKIGTVVTFLNSNLEMDRR